MVGTRRDLLAMPLPDVQRLSAAFNALKADGRYDEMVRRHVRAMNTATPSGSSRNAAHRGPVFLPWHRAALVELEDLLRSVDPLVEGLPYWRWELETKRNDGDPRRSRVWTPDYLGTDGDPARGDRVLNGPFAHWVAVLWNNSKGTFTYRSTPGLIRRLGRDRSGSTSLPTPWHVDEALKNYTVYDAAPWDTSVSSFRNRLEGWSGGPRLHNRVHRWVGGDMLVGTSPNDPVFWLQHCNVDRIWWAWQRRYGTHSYQPVSGGPAGHNIDDPMVHLLGTWTPRSVLDTGQLQYSYVY